ncbi:hypothetical protein KBD71_02635 [Candidatus Woesebacteria bacterium]|nr:hypothetical protein [Candidatus Woesebacteria bacterium]
MSQFDSIPTAPEAESFSASVETVIDPSAKQPEIPPEETPQPSVADTEPLLPDVVEWSSIPENLKLDQLKSTLEELGANPADVSEIVEIATLAKNELKALRESTPISAENGQSKERNARAFTIRETAGIGLLLLLDLSINNGRGLTNFIDELSQRTSENVVPSFMEKMGFDPEFIKRLHERSKDFGRAWFQLDKKSLYLFFSQMNTQHLYETLDSLTDEERKRFILEGSLGNRDHILHEEEIKHLILDRLSEEHKKALGIDSFTH